jgi:hypothetical protein
MLAVGVGYMCLIQKCMGERCPMEESFSPIGDLALEK